MPLVISGKLSLPVTGQPASNAEVRFRAVNSAGEIIQGAESTARCDASGNYSISIEFARYELATKISTPDFIVHGQVTINSKTVASDLDDLITSIGVAPILSDQLIADFEALKNAAEAAAKSAEDDAAQTASDRAAVAADKVEVEKGRVEVATNTAAVAADKAEVEKDRAEVAANTAIASSKASEAASSASSALSSENAAAASESAASQSAEDAKYNANQTFISGGLFTPTSGSPYPPTAGVVRDTIWLVEFASHSTTFTYTSGDLNGITVTNGDMLFYDTPRNQFDHIPTNISGVLSVNGQTGPNVNLDAADVGAYSKAEANARYLYKDAPNTIDPDPLIIGKRVDVSEMLSGYPNLSGSRALLTLPIGNGGFQLAARTTGSELNFRVADANSGDIGQWERFYTTGNKPTWSDVGGNNYIVSAGGKYRIGWNTDLLAGGVDMGFLPREAGTGDAGSNSFLGKSNAWFKEAWANEFHGGSVAVTGTIEGRDCKLSRPSDTDGWPVNTVSDPKNYINKAILSTNVNNNSIHFFGDGGLNARRMGIQAGHSNADYTTSVGTLELNPFGGEVRVNGHRPYTTGSKPTAADVGAAPASLVNRVEALEEYPAPWVVIGAADSPPFLGGSSAFDCGLRYRFTASDMILVVGTVNGTFDAEAPIFNFPADIADRISITQRAPTTGSSNGTVVNSDLNSRVLPDGEFGISEYSTTGSVARIYIHQTIVLDL